MTTRLKGLNVMMQRYRKPLRIGAIALGILSLGPAALHAAPAQYAPLDAVFQSSVDACEALQATLPNGLSDVPQIATGVAPTSPAEGALSSGICLYQLLRTGTNVDGLMKAVGDFEKAQTLGLEKTENATANIMEGLASCQVAALEINPNATVSAPTNPPGPAPQTALFCAARKNALASFSRLKLGDLRVSFPASTGLTSDGLMAAVTSCYDVNSSVTHGALNEKWAAQCGVFTADSATINAAVAAAHAKIQDKYFVGGEARLTAMFVRKKQLADSTYQTSNALKETMKAEATGRIKASYDAENSAFKSIDSSLTQLVQGYQATYSTSTTVQQRLDSWVKGLFKDRSHDNYDYSVDIGNSTSQVGKMFTDDTGFVNPQKGAKFVLDDAINALQARATANAQVKANARQLCKAYYCELAYQDKPVGNSSFKTVCNAISSQASLAAPLCNPNGTTLSADNTAFSVKDFCTTAFDGALPAYMANPGMTSTNRNTCWATP